MIWTIFRRHYVKCCHLPPHRRHQATPQLARHSERKCSKAFSSAISWTMRRLVYVHCLHSPIDWILVVLSDENTGYEMILSFSMLFISIVVKEASSFLEDLLALVNSKRHHIIFFLHDRAVLGSVHAEYVASRLNDRTTKISIDECEPKWLLVHLSLCLLWVRCIAFSFCCSSSLILLPKSVKGESGLFRK